MVHISIGLSFAWFHAMLCGRPAPREPLMPSLREGRGLQPQIPPLLSTALNFIENITITILCNPAAHCCHLLNQAAGQ